MANGKRRPLRSPLAAEHAADPRPPGPAPVAVRVEARNPTQQVVIDLWPRSRVLFLIGPAGVGKSAVALGLAARDVLDWKRDDGPRPKLFLTRPMVGCDEDIGFLPGGVEEKLGPWLAPFRDVLRSLSFSSWDELTAAIDVEVVPVGMLRGRTVSHGVLVADECQGMTDAQMKCLLSRIGHRGRLVLCADPDQNDGGIDPRAVPVHQAAARLAGLDGVAVVRFGAADQVRDPLVSAMLDRLEREP